MFGVFKKGHKYELIIAIIFSFASYLHEHYSFVIIVILQHSSRHENNLSKHDHFLL